LRGPLVDAKWGECKSPSGLVAGAISSCNGRKRSMAPKSDLTMASGPKGTKLPWSSVWEPFPGHLWGLVSFRAAGPPNPGMNARAWVSRCTKARRSGLPRPQANVGNATLGKAFSRFLRGLLGFQGARFSRASVQRELLAPAFMPGFGKARSDEDETSPQRSPRGVSRRHKPS